MGGTIWSFPTRILFGTGSVAATGVEARRAGGTRALVGTDKGVMRAGMIAPVESALKAVGIDVVVFDEVLGNPVEKNVHDGLIAYRDAGADVIVAVGGGLPLDVDK